MRPYLTMHTTDEQDRVWIDCTCGWVGDTLLTPSADAAKQAIAEAVAEGRAHLDQEHPEI
jgi:hypothetical protein